MKNERTNQVQKKKKKSSKTKGKLTKEKEKMKNEWKYIEERRIYIKTFPLKKLTEKIRYRFIRWNEAAKEPTSPERWSAGRGKEKKEKKMRNKYNVLWKHQKRNRDRSVKSSSYYDKELNHLFFFSLFTRFYPNASSLV